MPSAIKAPSSPIVIVASASELGCILDCDVLAGTKIGGGTPTDNTAIITAFLAGASATSPRKLIIDGGTACTGIAGPAGGHWSIQGLGMDTGFFVLTGSNTDAITNYVSVTGPPSSAPSPRGQNVTLSNFMLNGNRGTGTNGNVTSGDPRGQVGVRFYLGISLYDLDNVTLSDLLIYNTSTFCAVLTNCGNATVDNVRFEPFAPTATVGPTNQDGLHISGPGNDIRVSNCYFRTGDDAIALNAPEGRGGDIVRVTVTNCVSYQSQLMMRLYSDSLAGHGKIMGVNVSNYSGTANVFGFLFGIEASHTPAVSDAITDISISNCTVNAPVFAVSQDNIGTVSFTGCRSVGATQGAGMLLTSTNPHTINSASFYDCTVERVSGGTAGYGVLDMATGSFGVAAPTVTVNKLKVNGFQVVDANGGSFGAAAALIATNSTSTIGRFQGDAIDISLLTHSIDPASASRITATAGTNGSW